jgi:hypothetical protein
MPSLQYACIIVSWYRSVKRAEFSAVTQSEEEDMK